MMVQVGAVAGAVPLALLVAALLLARGACQLAPAVSLPQSSLDGQALNRSNTFMPDRPYGPDRPFNGPDRPYSSQDRPYNGPDRPYGGLDRPYGGSDRPYGGFEYTPQSGFYRDPFSDEPWLIGAGDIRDNEVDVDTGVPWSGRDELQRCPPNWLKFKDSCYRFTKSPDRPRNEARKICQAYEADLVSVNSPEEHGFIVTRLMMIDPHHGSWYTGARQQTPGYWISDGDNSQLRELENAFLDERYQPYQPGFPTLPRDYLVYRYSLLDARWGLYPVDGTQYFHFICEGQMNRLSFLIEEERSFTYGLDVYDPERIPRGPYFVEEPKDTIYDPLKTDRFVQITCRAGGYPAPTYKWFIEEYEQDKPVSRLIDPLADDRFTISGGNLIIYTPDAEKDSAKYHCTATNKFGTVRSESVLLSFGYIREFNFKRPPESGNQYWGKVMYCDPPPYYPSVNYYWARGSFPTFVQEDLRVFVSYDGGLYFSALETIDRGNYSCNVQSRVSDVGRNGPFFPLSVFPHSDYQQLKFPNNFPKVFPDAPVVGEEVRLECISFGYPVPSYNWTRRGAGLPRRARLSSYGRVLTLASVRVEDEGEYVCEARNDRAAIHNSVFLRVQAAPNFTLPLGDKHADSRADLHWSCEAFGIPDLNYTWWRDGRRIVPDSLPPEDRDRYRIQDNVLSIKRLDGKRDAGMYQCAATNQLTTRFSAGQLRVLALKPSFKKKPLEAETYGSEGGNVTLRCTPEAAPRPSYTWKKDGVVIGAGGKRQITEWGSLIIRQLSRDDAGTYTCVAKNQYGADESRGRLIVLRAPRFLEKLPARVTAAVRDNVFLHCTAETDPLLDTAYLWRHNGLRVRDPTDPFVDRRVKAEGGELSIFNVSLADVGEYECIVKSTVGRIHARTFLQVEGPPGPPGGLQVLSIQRAHATLEWTDGAANGRPIFAYVVSGRTNWNSTWHVINENVGNAAEVDRYSGRKRAVITDPLVPHSVYEFRVQAVNALGLGEPSAPSPQFSTPPDKPTTAPRDVTGGGGKIGDLTITWRPLPPAERHGPHLYYKVFWRRVGAEQEYQSVELKEGGAEQGAHVVRVQLEHFYTPYEVKVQAWNEAGAGPESAPAIVYSAEDMPQVAPQQVFARSYNSTALNVTWLPVDESRARLRGRLIGHRLKYWLEDKREEECIYYLSRSKRPWALVVGLRPDTYYYVKVMAFNGAGEGPESERYKERTYRKAPQKPPASVQVFGVDPSTVRVVWRYVQPSQEEEPLLGYKVRVWPHEQDMSVANDTLVGVERRLEAYVRGLQPGSTYSLRVLAYSNGGDGRMSSPTVNFKMGDYRPDALGYYSRSAAAHLHAAAAHVRTFAALVLALAFVL